MRRIDALKMSACSMPGETIEQRAMPTAEDRGDAEAREEDR